MRLKNLRQPSLTAYQCLLPGQPETMTEGDLLAQIVVSSTPAKAVEAFVLQCLSEGTLRSEDHNGVIRVRRGSQPWVAYCAYWGVRVRMVMGPK